MEPGLFLMLLGLGVLFVFGDFFNSTESEDSDDAQPEEEASTGTRSGTDGDDLLFSNGGEALEGLGGNDTLMTDGDSTLLGGAGNDTLISIGGGALLNGGEGEDIFQIALLGVADDGTILDFNGQPVAPTVIEDFDPDEDRLVLDLRQSALLPEDDSPVLLTGIPAPDGDGLMVQVDGVNVVQLSNYGGTDMQDALEIIDIDVIGAAFAFPDPEDDTLPDDGTLPDDDTPPAGVTLPGTLIEPGLSQVSGPGANTTFFVSNAYSGDGNYSGMGGMNTVDLTLYGGNLNITVDEDGFLLITDSASDDMALQFESIQTVILGEGTNTLDSSGSTGDISVVSNGGENTIIGGQGENILRSNAGNAQMVGGAGLNLFYATDANDTIIGGDGQNFIFAANDGLTTDISVEGMTTIIGGPGDDEITAGLGDVITGGSGADTIAIRGGAGPDIGPAIVTDLDPEADQFFYTPDATHTGVPVLEERDDGSVALTQGGRVVVVFEGVTLAEIDAMREAGNFSVI